MDGMTTARNWLLVAALGAALVPGPRAEEAPPRGWLGVFVEDVDGGVELMTVVPGGPADRHGLRGGDILVRAEETDLGGLPDLEAVLARHRPGDELRLVVVRGNERLEFAVRLGGGGRLPRMPDVPPAPPAPLPPGTDVTIGWVLADVTPDLRVHFGGPETAGVLVTAVSEGLVADVAGLEVGDLVVALEGRDVGEVTDVDRVVARQAHAGRDVTVSVVRAGSPRVVKLVLADRAAPGPHARTPLPSPSATSASRAAVEQAIENEIRRLERRILELQRELEELERPAP
jgi:serine protease Do